MDIKCKSSCSSGEEARGVVPSDGAYFQNGNEMSLNDSSATVNERPVTSQPKHNESLVSESKDDIENYFTLKALPNEILIKIFSFLRMREILEVSSVCWKFNLLSKDVSLWRQTEVDISSNEELQNFCRYFRVCHLLNTRENTIVRHPFEALTQVFSHLSKEEVLETSIAIWKFNHQSKNASLWQMIKLIIRCEEKLKNIFSVMDQATPIKCLSLIFCQNKPNLFSSSKRSIYSVEPSTWRLETSELNEFFKHSKQLYCLNLQSPELASIILPPTVKHISISLNYGSKGYENNSDHSCLDAVSQLSLLRHCPNSIEHLGLYAHRRYVELTKSIKDLLIKFQLSLTSLHLDILHTSKDLIPLISNCTKLKKIGLYLYDSYEPDNQLSFLEISNMPNLKGFTLKTQYFHSYSQFRDIGFFKLVYFHVNCEQSYLRKIDFKVLLSSMPILETFLYNAHIPYQDGDPNSEEENWENVIIDFCEYIKNCSTLKQIGIDLSSFHNKPKAYLVKKIIPLQKQRHFESVCLCKLIFKGPNEKLYHAKELCEMLEEGLCKTCMYSVDESYKCSCWKQRGRASNGGYKRHLNFDHIKLNTLESYDQLIDRELAANEGRVHSESHCNFAIR